MVKTKRKAKKERKMLRAERKQHGYAGEILKSGSVKSGDFWLVLLALALSIFGVIMVFSASYYYSINKYSDPYHYLIRDLVWVAAGIAGMLVMTVIDYRIFAKKKVALAFLGFSILFLVLIFTPLGVTRNLATRWIGIGKLTFMPGEFAKIAAIIFTAYFLSQDPRRIHSLQRGVLPLLGLCVVYMGLIVKQPNLSTAITVCGIIVGMMFVAGLSWGYIGAMVGAAGLGIFSLTVFLPDSEWAKRITSFLDPFADPLGDGYQVVQSLLALGTGGLFGTGLGKSVQKNLYLPEPQNDFILAIIGEELGYIGVIFLMICYLLLIWRGIHISVNANDTFGSMLAAGITIMIALQVIMNIAVVTSSMPPTGVTLPFVSYGGNATLLFLGSVGILLNISRHSAR